MSHTCSQILCYRASIFSNKLLGLSYSMFLLLVKQSMLFMVSKQQIHHINCPLSVLVLELRMPMSQDQQGVLLVSANIDPFCIFKPNVIIILFCISKIRKPPKKSFSWDSNLGPRWIAVSEDYKATALTTQSPCCINPGHDPTICIIYHLY